MTVTDYTAAQLVPSLSTADGFSRFLGQNPFESLGLLIITTLFLYTCSFLGDWICLFNQKRQTLQDFICKTYVVRR